MSTAFCIALNKKMKKGGVLIGCFESYDQRKRADIRQIPALVRTLFLCHRLLLQAHHAQAARPEEDIFLDIAR